MTVATTVSSAGRASEQRCDQEVVPQKVVHNPRHPRVAAASRRQRIGCSSCTSSATTQGSSSCLPSLALATARLLLGWVCFGQTARSRATGVASPPWSAPHCFSGCTCISHPWLTCSPAVPLARMRQCWRGTSGCGAMGSHPHLPLHVVLCCLRDS